LAANPGGRKLSTRAPSDVERKKKEPKKKERGGLWKLPQPWKSEKVAFGDIFIDDFHRCLEKPPQRTLRLFHSSHRPGGG
jgi:hypothetical protein